MSESKLGEQVKAKVKAAIVQFLKQHADLLKVDANERAISHVLAVSLKEKFPSWDTDCEYNRDGHATKMLRIAPGKQRTPRETIVVPDIVVHRRGTSQNLVVIEIKKTSSRESHSYDLKKLQAFKRQLGYKHALFLKFKCGGGGVGVKNCKWVR